MWDTLFSLVNAVALAGWLVLLFTPRHRAWLALVRYGAVGLLCLAYAALLLALATGALDPVRDAGAPPAELADLTVAGLRRLFASDGALVLGWTHYLALDLLAGLWIAREADAARFPRLAQAQVLLATFLAGPIGVLAWLVLRPRRRRVA
jgi:hypothetical protein